MASVAVAGVICLLLIAGLHAGNLFIGAYLLETLMTDAFLWCLAATKSSCDHTAQREPAMTQGLMV